MSADPRQKLGTAVPTDPITGKPKKRQPVGGGGSSLTARAQEAPVTDTPSEEMKNFRLAAHLEEEHGGHFYFNGRFLDPENPANYEALLQEHARTYPGCVLL